MSTTLNLPYKRFVAQVSTGAPRPKSTYLSLMTENLEALKACPWREASDIPVALVDHDFTKASHLSDAHDAFKMTGAWNADTEEEVAFAGMAAYRFAIPASAASVAISSVTLPISRDRFLLGGVHVAAVLDNSATPSDDWAVVTGQGASAHLANSAANIVASRPADGALTITSTDLASLATTGKDYLWIYVTLEDYVDWWQQYSATEARQYAIEGSAMLVGGSATVTFAGDVSADTPAFEFAVARGGTYPRVAGHEACARYVAALHDGSPVPELHTAATDRALHIFTNADSVPSVGTVIGLYSSPRFAIAAAFTGSIQVVLCTAGTYLSRLANIYRDGYQTLTYSAAAGCTPDDFANLPGWAAVADGSLRRVVFALAPWTQIVNGTPSYHTRIVLWAVTDTAILPMGAFERFSNTVDIVKWDSSLYTAAGSPGGELSLVTTKTNYVTVDGDAEVACSATITPVSVGDRAISVGEFGSVEFDGDVYGLAQDFGNLGGAFWVYGRLRSVGGKACRNVAHCELADGALTVTVPTWDATVTPDTYSRFHVTSAISGDVLLLSGDFTSLGGTAASHFASVDISSGSLGDKGRLAYVADMVAWSTASSYLALTPNRTAPGVGAADVPAAPAAADYASAGLRATYARLFMGDALRVRMPAGDCVGASIRLHYATRSMLVDGTATEVPFWTLATTCAVVPFSVPQDVRATAVRLDWSAIADATAGAYFAVWIRASEYLAEISDDDVSDPALYLAAHGAVGKWRLVGRVAPADTTATLKLPEPLTGMVATLLLTAYVPQDDFNPAAGMTVPRGVEQSVLPVDPIDGDAAPTGTGWKPDITLVV